MGWQTSPLGATDVRFGSIASVWPSPDYFRYSPISGHSHGRSACPVGADTVAKVENPTMSKSRESGFLETSTAATHCSADAKVRGHFCAKQ
jgi:hypothetical protein